LDNNKVPCKISENRQQTSMYKHCINVNIKIQT